ncbi:glutathione synthetase [bacterium BMS3Bbin11]|nr:glutathione synthetase [bacterium BMS3Abin11]GBE46627.1 glutathione synthetase [bacterium BMS3Bbin11]GMT39766.1 MAG: glutathione synthetase [bacterium]HDH08428.1 glutathione synthase [Gammaproteobacteria bacterium]HDH16405.1 glutathione synthase [Gammaproteobacteria bacterium]
MNKPIVIGVIMDPIEQINIVKDSTWAMILAAQKRGWQVRYMQQTDLFTSDGITYTESRAVKLLPGQDPWLELSPANTHKLSECSAILMRKDPPFDLEYIYTTYMLELIEQQGTLVVNKPQSLRDCNEKFFTTSFPLCAPPTLVTRSADRLRQFIRQHEDCIFKPLDGMGGSSIFRVQADDPNKGVIIETLTQKGATSIMAQRFIAEIREGDKRILMVNGNPAPYALARIPLAGETRGNLAAGGIGKGIALSDRDYWICEQVGPVLKEKGILFAGLDVIGDYLTEINVTSPTCIRELDKQFGLDIAGDLMDAIELRLPA